MVSLLVSHVFDKFKICVECGRNSWVICVMLDLVFVVFIDDVVVVLHTFCCCCVYIVKGDILMPRKLVVVCSGG